MKKLSEVLREDGKSETDIEEALSGTVKKFMERDLPKPITYKFDPNQFTAVDEAKNAGKWPNDSNILDWLNRDLATSAKAQAYQKATADLRTDYEKSSDFKRANLLKAAVAGGMSQEQAEALVASIPGLQ